MSSVSYLDYRHKLVEEVKKQGGGDLDEYYVTYIVSVFLGNEEDEGYLDFFKRPIETVASSIVNQIRIVEEEERIKAEKRLKYPYKPDDKGLFHQEDVWDETQP